MLKILKHSVPRYLLLYKTQLFGFRVLQMQQANKTNGGCCSPK